MLKDGKIFLGLSNDEEIYLIPKMANRHGLIAGATGTGKTVTMKVLAESFSSMGVPVFMADIKGDLSGMCCAGTEFDVEHKAFPTRFYDVFNEAGIPVRVTISAMGPAFLARLLDLSEAQTGILNIVFKVADEHGLLLLDLKDLQAMLSYIYENAQEFSKDYGNITKASVSSIQRALLAFESEGGTCLFGEPMLDTFDFIKTNSEGLGYINILNSKKLVCSPLVYSTFLLWMLTDLYEKLPEVGDLDKPRLVFFFDEAHMIFEDAPKALISKVEQIAKLIRSKGVGIYFVTQNPADISEGVLAQLSNRIQHGLRAYTPNEQKGLKAAANSFRVNPEFNTEEKLQTLGVGEALVSCLDETGVPNIVKACKINPPQSKLGIADEAIVKQMIISDELMLKYGQSVDRESAYEILQKAKEQLANEAKAEEEIKSDKTIEEKQKAFIEKEKTKTTRTKKSMVERAASNAASSVARSVSTNIINSVLGGKTSSASTIAKRAASNALSSAMRGTATSLIRGIFGNLK